MSTVVNGVGEILQRCREEGRAALVGYLPVGFPTVEGSHSARTSATQPIGTCTSGWWPQSGQAVSRRSTSAPVVSYSVQQ